jgi:putative addiction module antidote
MALTVKLIAIGNSTGVIFPKELLEKLRVERGDELHVLDTARGVEFSALNHELATQMDVAERVMRKRRNLLRKLAE